MAYPVTLTRQGEIALVTIDNPPVNASSQAVRAGVMEAIDQADTDPAITAIILRCAGRTFVAGADITEFGKPPREPLLSSVIARIERTGKPVTAAIHGTALGGGFELAMGCHYRVAVASAKVGLPEVKLGLLPGAGGTQRLPRLIGVKRALAAIASGDFLSAGEAHAAGAIDAILPDIEGAALVFAQDTIGRGLPKVRDRDAKLAEARDNPTLFTDFAASIAKRSRGFKAPAACIEAVKASVERSFDDALRYERELFMGLMATPECKAQRYFFFAEREAAKLPGIPSDTPAHKIGSVAVLGAGTMGGGIAMSFANAGLPVTLIDTDEAALQRGLKTIRDNYQATARRGGLDEAEVGARLGRITPVAALTAAADADLVIEAVFEDLALKREVFGALDRIAKPGALLASNTSTLDLDAIAASTGRPEEVVGMHFFSPANVMRLVEVVRGAASSATAVTTAMTLSRKLGKVPVLVGVCDGFVGNRMLAQRSRAAERLILEGADPAQVDRAAFDFGFPMGPFAMADLAGLDVGYRVRQSRGEASPVADRLVRMERLGQKTGAGYFRYAEGSRAPLPDPAVDRLIAAVAAGEGIERRDFTPAEILDRLILPMINEGAKILADGKAMRASDIDVIWVYGYGWPIYRGGPMFHADQLGLDIIRDRLRHLSETLHNPSLQPAPLIEELAAQGRGFADFRS